MATVRLEGLESWERRQASGSGARAAGDFEPSRATRLENQPAESRELRRAILVAGVFRFGWF